jgi:hypothetical protein
MKDAKLRELADAATEGPWTVDEAQASIDCPEGPVVDLVLTSADVAFIAAAREAVPRLLDRIAALRKAMEFGGEPKTALGRTLRAALVADTAAENEE